MEGFDTMNDAPEKIWVHYEKETDDAVWSEYPYTDGLDGFTHYGEYTRSDIAQARIADLEDQAVGFRESIRKALMDSEVGHEILDVCWKAYFPQEEKP
jgi:hypothetical protein